MDRMIAAFLVILVAIIVLIVGGVFSGPIIVMIRRRFPSFSYEGETFLLVGLFALAAFAAGLVVMYLLLDHKVISYESGWRRQRLDFSEEGKMPFRIEPLDIVIVLIAALLIFGPSRLPEIGRGIGRALNEFRKGTKEMVDGFTGEVTKPISEERSSALSSQLEPASGNMCAHCGAANVPDARFCNHCGARLGVQA